MSQKLKWGIMGTGMIAKKFAEDLPKSHTGKLVATASRGEATAERFADTFGGIGVRGYKELLLNREVEAVYISLPNHLHKEWAIASMEAGKHVLCEKPIGLDRLEAEDMFAASEQTGQVLVEAFMYRCTPLAKKIIEIVRSGVLGDIKLVRSNFSFSREASQEDARYHPDKGGGSIMDVGCYSMNLIRNALGSEPTEINATAHIHEYGVDDYAAGWLKFGPNTLATFTSGMTIESDMGTYFAGTKGRLSVDGPWFGENPINLEIYGKDPEIIEMDPISGLYALEADHFAATVRGDQKAWISKHDTIENMRTLDAIRRSAGVPV